MKKLYLDTNVIIDLLGERKEFIYEAQVIFSLGSRKKVQIYTSSICLATTFYFVRKRIPEKDSRNRIQLFLSVCNLLNPEVNTFNIALSSPFSDFEDALQHSIANLEPCDYIITRNTKDFVHACIPVCSPSEFLELWKAGL